ncbi:sirohydrochlorin chelatase [Agromyces sp. MMS24-JH15]|uniref:sirohydrochlorin chelatase n=1 Tax=Agromyces sp. MMS24-JH15 TaxID=3243765 RepID=UPI0037485B69
MVDGSDGATPAAPPLRLLAVTHGAPSPDNRAAIIRLVDAIATARPDLDIAISFVDSHPRDAIAAFEGYIRDSAGVLLPLVLSAGFHVRTGLTQGLDHAGDSEVVLAAELGPDERIVEELALRIEELGLHESDVVVLAAAGSNDPRAARECFETARRLAARLGRQVTIGFVASAVPRLHDAIDMLRAVHSGSRIIVGAYMLAPGVFYDQAAAAGGDIVARPLLQPDAPAPEPIVQLVLDRYEAALVSMEGSRG